MRRTVCCIGFCLLLAACGDDAAVAPGSDVPSSSAPTTYSYVPVESRGGGTYERGIGGGLPEGKVLLLFGKTGDPLTERSDRMLRTSYLSGSISLPTRFVEFQQGAGLSLRYGVITYDTFVLINENGEKLKSIVHPSQTELRSLLQ